MEALFQMNFTVQQVNALSNLALAHIGDGVYELMCRSWLCLRGNRTVKTLHRDTVAMVNAPAQARFFSAIQALLTQEEQDFYRRGKNSHTHAAPKNATPQEYACATGLETLFGALYLMGQTERLRTLFAAGSQMLLPGLKERGCVNGL